MMRLMRCMAAGLLLLWAAAASADSWVPLNTRTYHSANHQFRLKIHPGSDADAYDHFLDKTCGREPPGARAVMSKRRPSGGWTQVWTATLVNPAPASALVSNNGRYVVTLDNWYSTGYGRDVVVIYGEQGRLIRSLELKDFLPEDYVQALPRTFSSLWWSGENELSSDGLRLILRVMGPSRDIVGAGVFDVEIHLATGRPTLPSGPDWEAALEKAAQIAAEDRATEAAGAAWMKEPLVGPQSDEELAWHRYLREAYDRTVPDWANNPPLVIVLRSPDAPDYQWSVTFVRGAMAKASREGDARMLGSASQENLAAVVEAEARRVRPGGMKDVRIYVAVSDALRDRFAQALAHTGAEFIQLDPTKPIPQRPERLLARNAGKELCGK